MTDHGKAASLGNPEEYMISSIRAKDNEGNIHFPAPEGVWDHIDIAMVRDRYSWVRPHSLPEGRKIQLGAGFKIIDGWENFEYPDWDADKPIPDVKQSATDPEYGWAALESVAEIACYHSLDHLYPEQVVNVLKEVQRVLKPGGIFTVIVPHYSSQLANECIMHRSRYAIDTWRNIFSERQYKNSVEGQDHKWKLAIMSNFLFGFTERNLVQITQFMKESPYV